MRIAVLGDQSHPFGIGVVVRSRGREQPLPNEVPPREVREDASESRLVPAQMSADDRHGLQPVVCWDHALLFISEVVRLIVRDEVTHLRYHVRFEGYHPGRRAVRPPDHTKVVMFHSYSPFSKKIWSQRTRTLTGLQTSEKRC